MTSAVQTVITNGVRITGMKTVSKNNANKVVKGGTWQKYTNYYI